MNRLADTAARLRTKDPLAVLGLMTGTSMDGLDLCAAEISFSNDKVWFSIIRSEIVPYPAALQEKIRAILVGNTEDVGVLHYDLGRWIAGEALRLSENLVPGKLDAAALHGQTIHHANGQSTLQIGEPSFLAEALGIPVVSDFRARDISVGGTGAPLIPIVDRWLFQRDGETVLSVNLGGIANVTVLPPRSAGEEVMGFDTGPGMALLDEAWRERMGQGWDSGGAVAMSGMPDRSRVGEWLRDEFISAPPPKSTGRDRYGSSWLSERAAQLSTMSTENLLATLSLFTARGIAVNCSRWISSGTVSKVILGGGGSRHAAVTGFLAREFHPVPVSTTEAHGIDPDVKEALGFAVLGAAYFNGIPANLPAATGSYRHVILGKLTL